MAGRLPRSITSGSYDETWPVAGSKTAPSTNAVTFGSDSWHGPAPSDVSSQGVARPRALSGSSGTISAQVPGAGGAWDGVGLGRVRAADAAASWATVSVGVELAGSELRICDDTGTSTAASSPMTTAK